MLDVAARLLGDAVRDDKLLALRIPTDGSIGSVRAVLDRLSTVEPDRLTVHTPDLDDVFLALTDAR